ncbi:hypothetical protein EDB84DRAFT_1642548 [Lactarius hengduanensis]|nr:hypothetical protein EDB84DRAFT_1642548 [Lactarius hengduanensis]
MSDDLRTMVTKLIADGSNWVTYRDRMLWAVESRGLSEHLTEATITAAYTGPGDVNGLTPAVRWRMDQAAVKQLIAISIPDTVFNNNRRHFLLDRIGEMLGHVRCPQPDHDHDYPTTTTATQLQVVCTANRDHPDDNDNDRNDAAPSKHADDEERGSTTGDDCANNDCHSKTVSTSRGTLPTRWSYVSVSPTPVQDDDDDSSGRQPTRDTAASPPPRVHPAQLRSSTAIYALSGLLKYHTAALAFDNTREKRQTRRPMRARACTPTCTRR